MVAHRCRSCLYTGLLLLQTCSIVAVHLGFGSDSPFRIGLRPENAELMAAAAVAASQEQRTISLTVDHLELIAAPEMKVTFWVGAIAGIVMALLVGATCIVWRHFLISSSDGQQRGEGNYCRRRDRKKWAWQRKWWSEPGSDKSDDRISASDEEWLSEELTRRAYWAEQIAKMKVMGLLNEAANKKQAKTSGDAAGGQSQTEKNPDEIKTLPPCFSEESITSPDGELLLPPKDLTQNRQASKQSGAELPFSFLMSAEHGSGWRCLEEVPIVEQQTASDCGQNPRKKVSGVSSSAAATAAGAVKSSRPPARGRRPPRQQEASAAGRNTSRLEAPVAPLPAEKPKTKAVIVKRQMRIYKRCNSF